MGSPPATHRKSAGELSQNGVMEPNTSSFQISYCVKGCLPKLDTPIDHSCYFVGGLEVHHLVDGGSHDGAVLGTRGSVREDLRTSICVHHVDSHLGLYPVLYLIQ